MVGRVLELTRSGVAVRKARGFLLVEEGGKEIGRISLDEIEVVLVTSPGVMWSNGVLATLSKQGVPVMLLGSRFTPEGVVLPLDGHHAQSARFRAQADATRPFRKQAWASIVRQKIAAQADALARIGQPAERLRHLASEVRSGDPDNREAAAARAYWPLLMGKDFRRDPDEPGVNAILNYGYSVLRASTARAIVSVGLHPSLSVHHSSGGSALALADDLMEPFRPTVDLVVHGLADEGVDSVDEARKDLVGCLSADFPTNYGSTPLSHVIVRLSQSLARSYVERKLKLEFPNKPLPDESGSSADG